MTDHTTTEATPTMHQNNRRARRQQLARFEQLEPRILLAGDAPCITDIDADNRGLVVIQISESLRPQTVNDDNFQILTAGDDGLLNTDDDVAVSTTVSLSEDGTTVTIDAEDALQPNQRYAISVNGDQVLASRDADRLDAEFNGPDQNSGDGVEGGQFLAFAGPAPDDNLIARIQTSQGTVDIRMFPAQTPIHVQNFFRYADAGLYDDTIFHRSIDDFVVQGGGFNAETPDFPPIDTFDPITNEPGISNTRGTVALAKLGGDPNSGTSQFFFNVADNSGNLDNQNGGFTVFAEIADDDSLAVADEINALMTIDATSIQSAFSDLPINEETDTSIDPDDLQPENLVTVSRVSALYQLSAQPQNQLGAGDASTVRNNPNGAGSVRVIDLTGAAVGGISNAVDIAWGPSGRINRITLANGVANQYAIQVQNADVNLFLDQRRNPDGLAFISFEGAANNIRLAQPVAGFELAGATLPGGFSFDNDIDGDGRSDDTTSLYIDRGLTNQLNARADLSGDVIANGGIRRVNIAGDTTNTDFRIGNDGLDTNDNTTASVFIRGDAIDTGILSDIPINSIIANRWANDDDARHAVSAPSINAFISRGDLSPPSLTTTEGGINIAIANGITRSSSWTVAGDINLIRNRDSVNFNITTTGDINVFNTQRIRVSDINTGGSLNILLATELDAAEITTTGPARLINIRGDATNSEIDLNTSGNADSSAAARVFIQGNASDGFLRWNGLLNSLTIRGNAADFEMGSDNAGTVVANLANLDNASLNTPERLDIIRTGAATDAVITTFGSVRNATFNGDYSGEFTAVDALTLRVNGNASFSTLDTGNIRNFIIQGDLTDSDLNFFANTSSDQIFSTRAFQIAGGINNSTILFQQSIRSLSAASLTDSTITIGAADDITSLDDATPSDVVSSIAAQRIDIGPAVGTEPAFINSTIVAGTIENGTISRPQTNNAGQPLGVAADNILSLTINRRFADDITVTNFNTNPITLQDFQIRPGFQAPAPNA